ncbi:hypothetical protein EGH23_12905 [Halomicroarcula sp. F27]|uniref:KaiC-like domain-containing protein n=1 Tax=Haloarcula nitratireducens TaxID=2487749 RepID=A0AAW4PDG2_9EURY|nr:hypothetical protein [Halomicroarcula nitratireducens]
MSGPDEVLNGGFVRGRSYLVRGDPGTGKTSLGAHFLAAGVAADETAPHPYLTESSGDSRRNAASSGPELSDAAFLDPRTRGGSHR